MHKLIAGLIATMVVVAGCASPTHSTANQAPSAPQTTTRQGTPSASPTAQSSTTTASPQPTASSQPSSSANTLDACLHYAGHVYEVCTAYIANSSLAVLVPYYKYANGSNTTLRRYVTYRLGSRYSGQAYRLITARVAQWPTGTMEVAVPYIRIIAVHSSLRTNTATLTTQETWQVTTQTGRVVYQERNQRHTITMHRVPSYILHKWVVTNLQ